MGSYLPDASRPQQVTDNFTALKVRLIGDQFDRLNAVSAVPLLNPTLFSNCRERFFSAGSR